MTKVFTTTLIGLGILSLCSCKKITEALQTTVSASPKVVEFQIPALPASSSEISYKDVAVHVNIDSLIKANAPAFGAKNIRSVKLKSFTVELSNSDDLNNFANLESVRARIMSDGQPGVDIVSIENNPDIKSAALSVPLSEGGLELRDYLTKGAFRYQLKGKVRRSTTRPLQAKALVVYDFTLGF